jgi:hypothetical protein
MNTIQTALLLLLSNVIFSFAGTSVEYAFVKSLVTPPIGSTPDDWIALLGQPAKQFQNFGKPVDLSIQHTPRSMTRT